MAVISTRMRPPLYNPLREIVWIGRVGRYAPIGGIGAMRNIELCRALLG